MGTGTDGAFDDFADSLTFNQRGLELRWFFV
jgi:hypothetical protein